MKVYKNVQDNMRGVHVTYSKLKQEYDYTSETVNQMISIYTFK